MPSDIIRVNFVIGLIRSFCGTPYYAAWRLWQKAQIKLHYIFFHLPVYRTQEIPRRFRWREGIPALPRAPVQTKSSIICLLRQVWRLRQHNRSLLGRSRAGSLVDSTDITRQGWIHHKLKTFVCTTIPIALHSEMFLLVRIHSLWEWYMTRHILQLYNHSVLGHAKLQTFLWIHPFTPRYYEIFLYSAAKEANDYEMMLIDTPLRTPRNSIITINHCTYFCKLLVC